MIESGNRVDAMSSGRVRLLALSGEWCERRWLRRKRLQLGLLILVHRIYGAAEELHRCGFT